MFFHRMWWNGGHQSMSIQRGKCFRCTTTFQKSRCMSCNHRDEQRHRFHKRHRHVCTSIVRLSRKSCEFHLQNFSVFILLFEFRFSRIKNFRSAFQNKRKQFWTWLFMFVSQKVCSRNSFTWCYLEISFNFCCSRKAI